MTVSPPVDAREARSALAAEWVSRAPSSPEEINDFYRTSEHLGDDLEAFHQHGERQRWTQVLLHVVQTGEAQCVIDIGSGAGHDLTALGQVWSGRRIGVEPNDRLRAGTPVEMYADVADAPIEDADVLNCVDVLEHIVDPEAWLGSIAKRAKDGCMLLESCATDDLGTPLHLASNRGWHPGRVLQGHGWERMAEEGRLRVWIKVQNEPIKQTMLCVCAGKSISGSTFDSVMNLVGEPGQNHWRVSRATESGLLRARSIWASRWWRETCGDVFVMVDSDIGFTPDDLNRVAEIARQKEAIAVAAYSVRDGGHLALRGNPDAPGRIMFGPNLPPIEIAYGATGFMAVHRKVLDAMIPTLPLCHANQPWCMWPMFDFDVVEDPAAGGYNWLSEDWNFCHRAKQLGFDTWLDRTVVLKHYGEVPFTVLNMSAIKDAVGFIPPQEDITEDIRAELTEGSHENGRAHSEG